MNDNEDILEYDGKYAVARTFWPVELGLEPDGLGDTATRTKQRWQGHEAKKDI